MAAVSFAGRPPRKTIGGERVYAKIEGQEGRGAQFELRQRREVTLTSISVGLRGPRRCLRYIRKRLSRSPAFARLGTKVTHRVGCRRKGSRYVSCRALLHLRKCTNQTDGRAGQCTVVIPSRRRRPERNRNDRFYRLLCYLPFSQSHFLLSPPSLFSTRGSPPAATIAPQNPVGIFFRRPWTANRVLISRI